MRPIDEALMAVEDRKDFFISYNRADKAWAEWIAWHLEDAGYTVKIQAWDFRPGGNFVLEMDKASKEAKRTIAVLSPDFLIAEFTQPEWAAAFAQDPTGEKGILVPVRVRKCDVEGLLGQIIYIDLVGLDEQAAREALIAGVQQRRAKPSSAPKFPGAARAKEAPRFPGSLPSIWNVPHQKNPNFTGREQLLKDLRASLTGGQATALTQAAIHGLGGIGKTQLAVEYVYRHAPDYDLVWWVRSETPAALAADYAALAGPLDLPEKGAQEQEVAVAAVRQHLRQRGKWLMVFDNAASPKDIKNFLPLGGGGHVLITSREPGWGGLAKPLKVKVWPREEAVAFLLKRTGQDDAAAAGELAKELGDLPLALEQAAAYMEACGQSLSGYLQLFRQHYQELFRQGRSSLDYPDTVATTWELSFQKVEQESPAAADLLNLCAFLASDDIPRELPAKGVEHLPKKLAQAVGDPLTLNAALASLRRYSLMEVGKDSLAVHRLVQAVVRDRLDDKGKKKWAGAAVEMVAANFPEGDVDVKPETWDWCGRLLPHALAAAGQAEALRVALKAASRLLNQAGGYLDIRAEYVAARNAYERALVMAEEAFGQDRPEVAILLNNLGSVLRALGDLTGAQSHFERALAMGEAAYGPNHPNVAIWVNNLGMVLQDQGDLVKAKLHYERALAMGEAAFGPDHPKVALRVNNLGGVLRDLGDLEGAHSHYERALSIDEAAYGPNHPEVARDVNNLGSVLEDLGDLEGAKSCYERTLGILRQFLGDDHPKTKIVEKNLARLGLSKK
jgi:tetratricopeptide (TPR) repeat protein